MLRKMLLLAALATSVSFWGQTSAGPGMPAGTTQNTPQIVVVPQGPSVYVVGGGTYGTGIYLTSPGTLPIQSTGISFAGREGISLETPLQTGTTSFLPTAIPGVPVAAAMAQGYAGEQTVVAESGRAVNDLGPSYYAGAVVAVSAAPSLGEVAAQYKAHHPRSVRTFTNADVERLTNTITVGGTPRVLPQTPQQTQPPAKPPSGNPPP